MTTSALIERSASAWRSAFSVVVPVITAMRLPLKSPKRARSASAPTRMLPPSRKVTRLKSTSAWRDSVQVVVLHSTSTLFLRTASIRFWIVSATHRVVSFASPSCARIPSATARQISTEYP